MQTTVSLSLLTVVAAATFLSIQDASTDEQKSGLEG